MDFFSYQTSPFNQADLEKTILTHPLQDPVQELFVSGESYSTPPIQAVAGGNANQFIVLQLHDDPQQRLLSTTEVNPRLIGSEEKPDINLQIDFESFKISDDEHVNEKTRATLQLIVGQEEKLGSLDKLFYCLNGGLELFDVAKEHKAPANSFKQATSAAMGNKAISLPGGYGQLSLKVLKHQEPAWWQQIFSFARTSAGKELLSLVGFGGITDAAVQTIGNLLNNLFPQTPEILFESQPVKVAFSQQGKTELSGGLATNHVSCLNPGFWIMARLKDYQQICALKPVYFSGHGILAQDGMDHYTALSEDNPFSKITYAVMRVKMKETDLKQNLF